MIDVWDGRVAIAESSLIGESPWWDAGGGRLLWVDIPGGLIHAYEPGSESLKTQRLHEAVGFIAGRMGDGYVVGTAAGIVELDSRLVTTRHIGAPPDLKHGRRINDGVCDREGRVLFGTVDPSRSRAGTLWSLSADGSFSALVGAVGMSNGLAFGPNGSSLYFVDTSVGSVEAFRYDSEDGTVSDRRMLLHVSRSVGLPDGVAVDESGCLWLAIWGAGQVWRLQPDGKRTGIVHVSTPRVTSCAFGGAAGDLLFITTAQSGSNGAGEDRVDDLAGAVFVADVGAKGARVWRAADRFGGSS